jgi:cystathionine gamma-synthase
MPDSLHPATLAIHAGRGDRTLGHPLDPPMVLASNFHGASYAREQGSPTWSPLEEAIGLLEGGTATAFVSGIGDTAAILETLPTGARVVGPTAGYAWTPEHATGARRTGPHRSRRGRHNRHRRHTRRGPGC